MNWNPENEPVILVRAKSSGQLMEAFENPQIEGTYVLRVAPGDSERAMWLRRGTRVLWPREWINFDVPNQQPLF